MGAEDGSFERWLDSFLNFERLPQKGTFWLGTMEFLCARLGNPERRGRKFHVAGSKGKGSVSAMIASILEAAGISCGLYTSPHLADFRERVSRGGNLLPEKVYENSARILRESIEGIPKGELPGGRPLTWFELVTLYAFLCFREAGLEAAAYEVGLGGRLDATNVITPDVCCITPIELEHTEFLGGTLELVAAEKAGIIKEGVPVFSAVQCPSVRNIFERTAEKRNSPIKFVEDCAKNFQFGFTQKKTMRIGFEAPQFFSRPIEAELRMLGAVQAQNAALAALAAKSAIPSLTEEQAERGLSRAFLPARFEIAEPPEEFPSIPMLVLDGAHTPASARFTMETFRAVQEQKPALLFACAKDKDARAMAQIFSGGTDGIFLTRPGAAKAADMDALCAAFSAAGLEFSADEDFCRAIRKAFRFASERRRPLLVTGSFYLAAEVRKFICSCS